MYVPFLSEQMSGVSRKTKYKGHSIHVHVYNWLNSFTFTIHFHSHKITTEANALSPLMFNLLHSEWSKLNGVSAFLSALS